MTPDALYKTTRDDFGGGPRGGDAAHRRHMTSTPGSIGLWVFMGVVTSLFSLFIVAYGMRMDSSDWHPIALPWQVWLSTALLGTGCIAMAVAAAAARTGQMPRAFSAMRWGGLAAFAFVASQLWSWQALYTEHVVPAGNPAGSFFYMLTALHGLHVVGGLIAWNVAWFATHQGVGAGWRVRLCARYWHFLLAIWIVLLAVLGWMTPEFVRFICGRA
jgi:cytochrome c oxidase subunit 3